jgi:hypothetical protein
MEISVSHALVKLKLLDKQIDKIISNFKCTDVLIGKKLRNNKPIQDFEKDVKEEFQKLHDIISYRSKLKFAIVKSNANTEVCINNDILTVAEAIETKSFIKIKKTLLNSLRNEFHNGDINIKTINLGIVPRLDKLLEATFGKDQKIKSEDYDSISKPFLESNEAKLLDPINISQVIKNLETEIDEFESQVDIILSETNARTLIKI